MPESKTYLHVFDEESIQNLNKLESDGYIGHLIGPIGSGKESYVYVSTDYQNRSVAVKIHRHAISSFNKIPTYLRLRGNKTGGFFKRIDDWSRYEFTFQSKAFNTGINVPEPYRLYKNILVMQFIGEGETPARIAVKDTDFDKNEWYQKIIDSIIRLGRRGIVHGDLSPYNILNLRGEPYLIDFSQALKLTSLTKEYLERDIHNINEWFRKLGKYDIRPQDEVIRDISEEL